MENAFVIGNGRSRLDLDLNILRRKGDIYGCNYLYQDFQPHILIAVDGNIAEYIQNSGYAKNNIFYTRNPLKNSGALKIEKNYGYSSGPVAVTISCERNSRYIYLIGFDLMGLGSKNQKKDKRKYNNVYSGKKFYKKPESDETYYGNWISQIENIMKEYNDRKFIRVNPHLNYDPPEWTECNNYSSISSKLFLKRINTIC